MTIGRLPSVEGGIQPTIVDAKGDLITATAADTPARLAVGTNGQYLSADSTASTGLAWASVSAGSNWSLLNSGGTALTGAQTITVSGISGKDKIMILVAAARSASASRFSFRLNTDTASNYYRYGQMIEVTSTYSTDYIQRVGAASTGIDIAVGGDSSCAASGYAILTGCNSAGVKQFQSVGATAGWGGGINQNFNLGGYYNSATVISSISVFSETGNFNNGTVYVYTSA
jgi:hypothetical protein